MHSSKLLFEVDLCVHEHGRLREHNCLIRVMVSRCVDFGKVRFRLFVLVMRCRASVLFCRVVEARRVGDRYKGKHFIGGSW